MRLFQGTCTLPDFLVSDPWYQDSVKCRYHKKSLRKTPLEFDLCVKQNSEDGFTFLTANLILRRVDDKLPKPLASLNSYGDPVRMSWLRKKEFDIGIDTACLFVGSTAKMCDDNVIHTGGDGRTGTVLEFSIPSKTALKKEDGSSVLLDGGYYATVVMLDFDDSIVSEDFLVQHLLANIGSKDYQEV